MKKVLAKNAGLAVSAPPDAVRAADVVFLATPFQANEGILNELAGALAGKVLVDCTNPVGPGLGHGLNSLESGSQLVQRLAPEARVVKAFSIYGFENFENNAYPGYGVKPAMLFCGDDADAKRTAAELIAELGWEPVDLGGLAQALHLEHMTLLWVRMVRAGGQSPHVVWARLTRQARRAFGQQEIAMEHVRTRNGPQNLGRGRVEALSDGVFAIVITLLVLEIRVPHVDFVVFTKGTTYSIVMGPVAYAVGAALSWVSTPAAFVCYAAIALYFVFPHEARAARSRVS